MKAMQIVQPRIFKMVEVPIPGLNSDHTEHILVRTSAISLCGSDIPFFTGSRRLMAYPLAPGMKCHECVGRVIESSSERFQAGDHVVAIPENDQGLAEYYVARSSKAVKLPGDLSGCKESCLIQPLSTVMNAVDRLGDIRGKHIAVVGLGSMGLFFCWLLKKRGAGCVLGIDPIAQRCAIAERVGADAAVPTRSVEAVHTFKHEPGRWQPLDICIEAVGHQTETLNDCLNLVRQQGTVLAFGVPDQTVYPIEYEIFFRKNAHLIAVVTPDWRDYLTQARDLFLTHEKELNGLVTHHFPITDAATAFIQYERHEDGIVKAILDASVWES
jgi:L-iditol 2-dehydrogenase